MLFDGIDAVVTFLPEWLIDLFYSLVAGNAFVENPLRVHLGGQHIFIVGAIEYFDHTSLRQGKIMTPEIIVLQFVAGRCFEAVHPAPLRVDPRHHVPDHAILAGGIASLKNDQQGVTIVSIKHFLQLLQFFDVSFDLLFCSFFCETTILTGSPVIQADFFTLFDTEFAVIEIHGFLLFLCHIAADTLEQFLIAEIIRNNLQSLCKNIIFLVNDPVECR